MANRWGDSRNSARLYFLGLQNHCRWWLQPWNKRRLLLGSKVMTNLDSIFKSRDITLPTKVRLVKAMVFPVIMYGCESWTVKKAECRRIDAFELWCWRRLLDCKEIQPVHSEGDQPWDFFGRNDVKAETPVLWPPHVRSWLIGKDSDVGRDLGQEEKGTTEDEVAGWHYRLDGCEFEWTPGVGDGQGGLACCYSWGREESDTTEWLNWTELKLSFPIEKYNTNRPTPTSIPQTCPSGMRINLGWLPLRNRRPRKFSCYRIVLLSDNCKKYGLGVLWLLQLQRVGRDWVTELNWTDSWFTMLC